MRMMWTQDRGDVILSGLLHTTLFLVAVALVVYEVGAVVVNSVQLDSMADDAARSAARAAAADGTQASVESAVLESLAGERGVVVDAVTFNESQVSVNISREPLVLIAHRVPAFEDWFVGRADQTALVSVR